MAKTAFPLSRVYGLFEPVACGNSTGAKIDKLERFELTAKPGRKVAVPSIEECYASLECRVRDTRLVREYGCFVLEVLGAWVDKTVKEPKTLHHRGKGVFAIAGKTITLPSRMK